MKLRLESFLGEFPKQHPSKLPNAAAETAKNVSISSGNLKPFFSLKDDETLPALPDDAVTKAIHLYRIGNAEYWLQFSDYVNLIRSPIKDDLHERVYWSGDSRDLAGNVLYSYAPVIYDDGEPYPNNWVKLGITNPSYIPTITSSTPVPSGDDALQLSTETRVYVYTYVNAIGEESAPSNPSSIVTVPTAGATVVLGNMLTDPGATDLNITKKRIYRSLADSSGAASFRFLAEIDVATITYTDLILGTALGEELLTTTWDTPRAGMQGLGLTAYGMAYGFSGKIICLSEPFYVYAWPRNYELTTQYDIVAMGHYESNIIVATTGNPVMVTGIDPSGGLAMMELPITESCVSKRSMVSLGYCAIYASPNGLVMASGNGAQLVSEAFFDKDEWNALNPASIHAVEHHGKYLFFWKYNNDTKGAYIFDPLNIQQGIIQLGIYADFAYRDLKNDNLYLLYPDGVIKRFDNNSLVDREPFVWRSKKFRAQNLKGDRMLAGLVVADSYENCVLEVIADDQLLHRQCHTSERPFRLPNHSAKTYWQVQVTSTDTVREIILAGSMQELMN